MREGRYHWSNCAPPARFFKINAFASVPWLVCLLSPGWITFGIAVGLTVLCVYVEVVRKMTLIAFWRGLLLLATGRIKSTVNIVNELLRG